MRVERFSPFFVQFTSVRVGDAQTLCQELSSDHTGIDPWKTTDSRVSPEDRINLCSFSSHKDSLARRVVVGIRPYLVSSTK